MLLGRHEERLALDRLLADARDGRSGVLGLVGEPGIGKTALLEYASESADGLRVLRARGIESEAEIPFAGLAELVRPILVALDRIPEPQAAALAGALALRPASAQDRFAIGAATLSLLSACAEEAPLLLLVDDAHLVDPSSAEAILFAARRLVADRIALVFAAREGEQSPLISSDLRVLHVPGLARSDAGELLAASHVAAGAVDRLYDATAGNPLALLELAPEAASLVELPPGRPVAISTSIGAAFLRRYDGLPESTRRLLLVAAAGGSEDVAVLARAAGELALDLEALEAAEKVGLLRLEAGRVEFRHPLARSAVYAEAQPGERRRAHAALAAALPDRDVDQRAWHLAAASVGPDREAASALEQAGVRALQRSAYAVAAAAFERAGVLDGGERRATLSLSAAEAAWLAGDTARTLRLLDEAERSAGTASVRAGIDYLRGQAVLHRGPIAEAYRLTVAAADVVAGTDPEQAVAMLAQAVRACFYLGDRPTLVAVVERVISLADRTDSLRAAVFAQLAQCMASVWSGDGERGVAAARRAIEILETSPELSDDPRMLGWAAIGPLWVREADTGRALLERASERARGDSAVGVLPGLLHYLARDQATTDQWRVAEANYGEAIRLAGETGQRAEVAAALAGLAWLEARQGRETACRSHAVEARELCAELGIGFYGVWAVQALGDLELGLGRPSEAIEHYDDQLAELRRLEIADVDLSPAPELVEANLRLGRREEASAYADEYEAAADAKGQPWALARAARCRGLLAPDDALDLAFGRALAEHARTADAFETARTQLAYGVRLRRNRQRVQARGQLREAHATFERLGAASWAEQAAGELAATGETARRRDASTLDELTPQELQIALLLADGKTTREAAAAVFLSPKTVEYHLRNVYRKLGIRSRAELAAAFRS